MSDSASFYNKTRTAHKIIVVDLGFLGDSVHTVPALREIKRNYPSAELHVLSAPVGSELFKLTPSVDRAWSFPVRPAGPRWRRNWDIIRQLRRERFDLVFNFSGADRTIFLSGLCGAKWKVAYPGGRDHFWNRWLIPEWLPKIPEIVPVYQKRRRMLQLCGLELAEPRFDLRVPSEDAHWAASAIPKESIHLSINASSPYKEWPLEMWVEFVRELFRQEPGTTIIATASQSQREINRLAEFRSQIDHPQLKTFSGLSIGRLAALLSRCSIHLGADSGVLHLAFALGIRTVSFFRQYERMPEWLPNGPLDRHLVSPCQCQQGLTPECTAAGRALCLTRIEPPAVLALLKDLESTPRTTGPADSR